MYASQGRAQSSVSARGLQGRVLEQGTDDFGVSGAQIRVQGTDQVVETDEEGRFVLPKAPRGPLVLSVEAPGYAPLVLEVSPKAVQEPFLVFLTWRLEEEEAVTVVAARAETETASTTRLTARDISAAPHRNAEEILRQVPGLTLVQHGSEGKGHQFFMRGFDAIHGSDLEINYDGVPLNEWSNVHAQGYLDLGIILPEMVHEVVATKGPFSLGQGAFAMAGSADYRPGVPDEERGWRASYTLGTTNRHRVFAGYAPQEPNQGHFAGAEATLDDGFGENRDLQRATFNGRARLYGSGDENRLDLTVLGGYSTFSLPGTLRNEDVEANLVDFYGTYDPRSEGLSARTLLILRYQRVTASQHVSVSGYGGYRRLELLENFTGFLIDPVHGDRREQLQDTWSFGLRGDHNFRVSEGLSLRTGLGVRGDVFAQEEHNLGRSLETLSTRRDLSGLQAIYHGVAGLRFAPFQKFRLDLGARLDLVHVRVLDHLEDGSGGDDLLPAVSPRATARWQPLKAWRLFLSYGRGFRPPEARAFSSFEASREGVGDDVFVGGGPTLVVSDALEAGTRWDPASWFGVSLSGFATRIERESLFDHVSGTSLELNGTRRLGAELVLYSDPLPWLNLSADMTVVDARFVESGNQVPLAPSLVSGVRGVVTHESGFRAGLRVLTVAPRTLPHGARGATLVMTDATLGYHWDVFRLDLELENVLNRALREGEYHYASHWRRGSPVSEIPVLHTTAGPPFNARLTLGAAF